MSEGGPEAPETADIAAAAIAYIQAERVFQFGLQRHAAQQALDAAWDRLIDAVDALEAAPASVSGKK